VSGFRTLMNRIEDTLSGRKVRSADVMAKGRAAAEAAKEPDFHAVGIRPAEEDQSCNVALALRGQRFLSADAPALPLPDCDALECNCTYRHYNDRRSSSRRASDRGMSEKAYDGTDRRAVEDRRQDGAGSENDLEEEGSFFTDAEDYFYR
jgi:hypothetical protein